MGEPMVAGEEDKHQHLQWLIESRHRNQRSALRLRSLLKDYEKQWKTKDLSAAAQELTSISFSLWRAAFLADKTGKRSAVYSHAFQFLERVIEDNAITYAQDKVWREWTFNYYTRAARLSLEYLNRRWPRIVGPYEVVAKRKPKERWEYCQSLLDNAIDAFEGHLKDKVERPEKTRQRIAAKAETKKKRKIVRQMQLEERARQKG
jgi:hypothetical protein